METDALGEAALGMALFILLWTTGVGYMSWYEVVQNTTDSRQETYHAIVNCAAAVILSAAALSVTTIIGTKTLSAMLKHFSRRDKTHSTRDPGTLSAPSTWGQRSPNHMTRPALAERPTLTKTAPTRASVGAPA